MELLSGGCRAGGFGPSWPVLIVACVVAVGGCAGEGRLSGSDSVGTVAHGIEDEAACLDDALPSSASAPPRFDLGGVAPRSGDEDDVRDALDQLDPEWESQASLEYGISSFQRDVGEKCGVLVDGVWRAIQTATVMTASSAITCGGIVVSTGGAAAPVCLTVVGAAAATTGAVAALGGSVVIGCGALIAGAEVVKVGGKVIRWVRAKVHSFRYSHNNQKCPDKRLDELEKWRDEECRGFYEYSVEAFLTVCEEGSVATQEQIEDFIKRAERCWIAEQDLLDECFEDPRDPNTHRDYDAEGTRQEAQKNWNEAWDSPERDCGYFRILHRCPTRDVPVWWETP